MINYEYELQRLLNKVNVVTSAHRHGREVRKEDLDALSNRQIDVEKQINPEPEKDGKWCDNFRCIFEGAPCRNYKICERFQERK